MKTIEDTKTFSELVRIGACTTAYNSNGKKLNHNVGENWFTPSFGEQDENEIILCDGQIMCWGTDDEISAVLSDLQPGCDFDDVWDALADLPNNA